MEVLNMAFDTVKSTVGTAVDTLSTVAQSFVEKNRTKAKLNRLRMVMKNESELMNRAYIALGKEYYEVLKKGAGHLNNTSLPIGGPGTHSVISAHSAFPSKTLFDYLLDMEEGDLFYIHVLDRVLEYKVDQIKTVLPNDVNDLYVTEGKDYVTLMTCTPYTVNTHRLLVRGERVPDDPDIVVDGDGNKTVDNKAVRAVDSGKSSMYVLGYKLSYVTIIIGIGVFLLVVAAVVVLAVRRGKGRKTKGGES